MKDLRALTWGAVLLMPFVIGACLGNLPRFGTGGRYEEGREQFLRGSAGDMDRAISALEAVVRENPTYKDSLTLLGRAYYQKRRFEDAHAVLQRALVVKKDDEIAWIVLGATQLRLNQNEKGLESMKGGITLLSKVAVDGYREYPVWDTRGTVRSAIRRVAFLLTKELENKDELFSSVNTLLSRIDDEDNFQRFETPRRYRRDMSG